MPRKPKQEHDFDDDFGKFNVGIDDEEVEHEEDIEDEGEDEEKELDFGSDNFSGLSGLSEDDE